MFVPLLLLDSSIVRLYKIYSTRWSIDELEFILAVIIKPIRAATVAVSKLIMDRCNVCTLRLFFLCSEVDFSRRSLCSTVYNRI